MAAELLTVICAWCNQTVTAGPAGAPVTHTICGSCLERMGTHPDVVLEAEIARPPPPFGYFGEAFKE